MKLIFKAHRISKLIALCALVILISHFRTLNLVRKKRNQFIFNEKPLLNNLKENMKFTKVLNLETYFCVGVFVQANLIDRA